MPVTRDSLKTNPYKIGAPPGVFVVTLRAEHEILTPTPPALPNTVARVDCIWTPDLNNPKLSILTPPVVSAIGDAYYLPYDNNMISSMRLPSPPPAGVDLFFTANMSGCKFFVDTINGSADLMVYHANARNTSAPPDHSPVDTQLVGAANELNRLHAAAQGDYAAAPYNLVLHNVASLAKPQYYGVGALAEQRKAASRTLLYPGGAGGMMILNPEFWGGCSVFGFYNAGWRFYYQTWGAVEYDRPQIQGRAAKAKAIATLHWNQLYKLGREGNRHGLDTRYAKVVDQRRFYP